MNYNVPSFRREVTEDEILVTIHVDTCTIVKGSGRRDAPSDLDYHGYNEVEFHAVDDEGNEVEVTDEDEIYRIEQYILEYAEDNDAYERERAAESRHAE